MYPEPALRMDRPWLVAAPKPSATPLRRRSRCCQHNCDGRLPGTKGRSSPNMLSFGSTPDWKSTSAIRKVRGNVERTRIPTDCCGSTFQKVRISAGTLRESSTQLLPLSTADLERRSTGERQPKRSTRSCADGLNQLLAPHRAPPSDASASDCTAVKIFEVRCEPRLRCDDQLNPGWQPRSE